MRRHPSPRPAPSSCRRRPGPSPPFGVLGPCSATYQPDPCGEVFAKPDGRYRMTLDQPKHLRGLSSRNDLGVRQQDRAIGFCGCRLHTGRPGRFQLKGQRDGHDEDAAGNAEHRDAKPPRHNRIVGNHHGPRHATNYRNKQPKRECGRTHLPNGSHALPLLSHQLAWIVHEAVNDPPLRGRHVSHVMMCPPCGHQRGRRHVLARGGGGAAHAPAQSGPCLFDFVPFVLHLPLAPPTPAVGPAVAPEPLEEVRHGPCPRRSFAAPRARARGSSGVKRGGKTAAKGRQGGRPVGRDRRKGLVSLACLAGVEPATPRSVVWCSIQLSYRHTAVSGVCSTAPQAAQPPISPPEQAAFRAARTRPAARAGVG